MPKEHRWHPKLKKMVPVDDPAAREAMREHRYRKNRKSTKSLRKRLWNEDRRCFWCGRATPWGLATIDHVIPLSSGGNDTEDNKVLCCHGCNNEKDDATWPLEKSFVYNNPSPRISRPGVPKAREVRRVRKGLFDPWHGRYGKKKSIDPGFMTLRQQMERDYGKEVLTGKRRS